ncbi:HAMP domain-containing protein, partial [Staphylococcus aureus]
LWRAISRPLQEAIALAARVARGDLVPLGGHALAHGRNETGRLMQALATMQGNLQQIVTKVRQGTVAISSAADEIGNGNRDLA